VPIRFTASLTELEPGEYECQVTVLDPGNGRAAFWRAPIPRRSLIFASRLVTVFPRTLPARGCSLVAIGET
jgi:hypothetical protein